MVLKVHTFLARWLSWLERRPVTAEVVGSNPIRVVYPQGYILISEYGILAQLGEHLPYKQRVTGSSPVGPIFVLAITEFVLLLFLFLNLLFYINML